MSKERGAELGRRIMILQIAFAPAPVLLGLGLYGMFEANGQSFIPYLDIEAVQYGCIGIGGLMLVIEFILLLPLLLEKNKLDSGDNT